MALSWLSSANCPDGTYQGLERAVPVPAGFSFEGGQMWRVKPTGTGSSGQSFRSIQNLQMKALM